MKSRNRRFIASALYLLAISGALFGLSSCKKWYDLPEDKDYLSQKVDLKTKDFTPVLGRLNLMNGGLIADGSTIPLKYEIINVRNAADSTATDALSITRPTYVWIDDYTGEESSLAEIEAKRKLEEHAAFEVRKSGEFFLWPSATNTVLPNYQVSPTPLKPEGYMFDVKISNSGGEKIIKDLTLRPLRERPYEPSGRDVLTGRQVAPITPTITSNMVGKTTRNQLKVDQSDTTKRDVRVLFKKTGEGNSLTIKVLDPSFKPIDPRKFNLTDWASLVHGFNYQSINNEAVRYDVAYPIPLTKKPTQYTTLDGSQANIRIGYSRIGFNGIRQNAYITFAFSIFEKGDWEIAFQFRNDTPKFEDE